MSAQRRRLPIFVLGIFAAALVATAFMGPVLAQELPETTAPCYPYFSCFAATAAHIDATAIRATATYYAGATQTSSFLNVTGTWTPQYFPQSGLQPLQSPTPLPTLDIGIDTTVEHSYVYNYLATVEGGLAQAPADLSNPGLPILPGTQDGELFGYIKWVFSTNIAYEVFGRFGEIIVHIGARTVLVLVMTMVSLLIVFATFVFKVAVWIVYKIREMLPL